MTSLEHRLGDQVLVPGRPGWDDELAGFNTAAAHRPDLVVAAEQPDHIAMSVRCAAEHGLPVGVQATGHGLSTVADSGILIIRSTSSAAAPARRSRVRSRSRSA